MQDNLIKSPNAARNLGIEPGTLRAWRVIGKGPKYALRTVIGIKQKEVSGLPGTLVLEVVCHSVAFPRTMVSRVHKRTLPL